MLNAIASVMPWLAFAYPQADVVVQAKLRGDLAAPARISRTRAGAASTGAAEAGAVVTGTAQVGAGAELGSAVFGVRHGMAAVPTVLFDRPMAIQQTYRAVAGVVSGPYAWREPVIS